MPLQETSGTASYDAFGGGAAVEPVYIEDVYSTFLYTGNGSTQTINNGIDVKTKGALVWIKNRTSANDNALFNMPGGGGGYATIAYQSSNSTSGSILTSPTTSITDATSGFSLSGSSGVLNASSNNYASWTFRKAPKFFDVVTWTGDGASGRSIPHSLGSVPGVIMVKRLNSSFDWLCYHRSLANPVRNILFLNQTAAVTTTGVDVWPNVTDTSFGVPTASGNNASGTTYVAYLFAHNAGGFGLTGTDNVISCGSFTTDGSGNATVNLGYEPQWALVKTSSDVGNWLMRDTMRGWSLGSGSGGSQNLFANLSNAEGVGSGFVPTATGFTTQTGVLANTTYIYIAIRRGPMKTPTSGTSVFQPTVATVNTAGAGTIVSSGSVVAADMTWTKGKNNVDAPFLPQIRLTGGNFLQMSNTSAEASDTYTTWDRMFGTKPIPWSNGDSCIDYAFKRAPGFFDVVCYTGNGGSNTLSHNLGTTPQMAIVKSRSAASAAGWFVNVPLAGTNNVGYLNLTNSFANSGAMSMTSTTFRYVAGFADLNASGTTYVAYLFASCPGVSKVGSYTGNGSTQTINCGFTGGARFVLIKRTDSTGDWYVYDTARGMTTLTDPYLLLNSTAAESATLGSVTTVSTGFAVNASILAAINTNGASYIYLAIA